MSWTYFPALADSVAVLAEPECEPLPSARLTHSAGASSQSTGLASPSTTTLPSSEAPTLDQLTLFAEVSPARTYPSQAREPAWQGSAAAYGQSTPDLLANY